jgi:hypothetical protein
MFGKDYGQHNDDVTVDPESVMYESGNEDFKNELLIYQHSFDTVYLRFFNFYESQGQFNPPVTFAGVRVFLKKDLNVWFDFYVDDYVVQYKEINYKLYLRFIKI